MAMFFSRPVTKKKARPEESRSSKPRSCEWNQPSSNASRVAAGLRA
ncbi:hypothetical protein ACFQQB_09675 [Nonomuraea rubra]